VSIVFLYFLPRYFVKMKIKINRMFLFYRGGLEVIMFLCWSKCVYSATKTAHLETVHIKNFSFYKKNTFSELFSSFKCFIVHV
jgi:hypothetical protein